MDCRTENRGFQNRLAGRGTFPKRAADRQTVLERGCKKTPLTEKTPRP